jgi:anti-sigma regulatory factor (Ser/Thr protein kinase)
VGDPGTLSLDLKFFPETGAPTAIRRFIEHRYSHVLKDADLLYRVAMAAHEFVENAVKYALDGAARFTVEIWQDDRSPRIAISLWNRTGEVHRQELQQIFAEMDSFQDAFEHYNRLLRLPSTRKDSAGVGLARIRAEGQMRLTLNCEDDRVCLRAEADLTMVGKP